MQIIPAQSGWTAIHCVESTNQEMKILNRPIICWALVEPLGEGAAERTQVRGVVQGFDELAVVEDFIFAKKTDGNGRDPNQYFLGYNDPEAHKESIYWIKQANDRFRTAREKTSEKSFDGEKTAARG